MDAADTWTQSLAQLTSLSTDIERAALVDSHGAVLAATSVADGERLAKAVSELFSAAPAGVSQVEVDLAAGSLFAVRDGERLAVVTTSPEPASALVLHDLRMTLRQVSDA